MSLSLTSESNKPVIVWLCVAEYHNQWLALYQLGHWPVVSPSSGLRLKRWTSVLDSYTKALCKPDNNNRHPIISIADEYDSIASFYGQVKNRPVYQTKDISSLITLILGLDCDSVLLVLPKELLSNKVVFELMNQLSIPWGVFTGEDFAAVSFFALKNLLKPPSTIDMAIVDSVNQTSGAINHDTGLIEMTTQYDPIQYLHKAHHYKNLIIAAHGDGGHANFHTVVLCGLFDDVETNGASPVLSGCTRDEEKSHCRRAHIKHKDIVYFSDLKTDLMLLLSCNGFSVTQQVFPSSLSSALACIDGYSTTFVSDYAQAPIPWSLSYSCIALLQDGYSITDIMPALDDFIGKKEMILIGDPSDKVGLNVESMTSIQIDLKGKKAVLLKYPPNLSGSIIEIDGVETVLKGKQYLAATFHSPQQQVGVTDKTLETHKVRYFARMLQKRLSRAVQLECAYSLHFSCVPENNLDVLTELTNLTQFRLKVEVQLQQFHRILYSIYNTRIWDQGAIKQFELLHQLIKKWDACLLKLMIGIDNKDTYYHMLEFAQLEHQAISHSGHCDRCLGVEFVTKYIIANHGQSTDYLHNCLVCGFRNYYMESPQIQNIVMTTTFQSGDDFLLSFELVGDALFSGLIYDCSIVFFDSGTRLVLVQKELKLTAGVHNFKFKVDDSWMAVNMQSVHIVCIGGFMLSEALRRLTSIAEF